MLIVLFVIDTVPETLFSVAVPALVLKATFESFAVCEVFTPSITLLASVKFVTFVPKMPLVPMFVIFMKLNDGVCVEFNEMAWPVVFWIVPPVQVEASEVHVPAFPLTIKLPDDPVLLRTMPLAPPVALRLRNVKLLLPMVVLVTLIAAPPAAEIVLMTVVLSCVAFMVAPLPDQ